MNIEACKHEKLVVRVNPYRNWRGKLTVHGASVGGPEPEDDIEVDDSNVFCLDCRARVSDGSVVVLDLNGYMHLHYPSSA